MSNIHSAKLYGQFTHPVLKAVLFCLAFTGLFILLSSTLNLAPTEYKRLANGLIGTLAAGITTAIFLKLERRTFADIGLNIQPATAARFGLGILIGLMLMGLLAGSVLYFSNAATTINPQSNLLQFLMATIALVPLAFMEELGFRAYPLEVLKPATGIRVSILITAVLFALYHVVSGWSLASSFYGPAVWGLLFGLAAVYSKGIALPTGIHYAANLTTAAFGDPGNAVSIWIVKQPLQAGGNGVDWITLLPMLFLLAIGILAIEMYVQKRSSLTTGHEKDQETC